MLNAYSFSQILATTAVADSVSSAGGGFFSFITPSFIQTAVRVILIILIGFPLVKLIRRLTVKATHERLSLQSEQLIQRFVYYLGILIILVMVLNEFGFKLSALLGAAGVFGLAIGFASQTSVSNIISGIFLISEKPFQIGDFVDVGGTMGTVESIDLLSIKLKTTDNRFVRVPNENMIKTEVINVTRYDTRRVNINVGVAYSTDLNKALTVLAGVAQKEELALKDLGHVAIIDAFADSGINIMFGVWCKTSDYWTMKNNLMIKVKEAFDANDIEIPFPHIELLTGKNKS